MNTDFSIIKRIPLSFREGTDIDFRAEFFNIFNHAQFGLPGGDVDAAALSGSLQAPSTTRAWFSLPSSFAFRSLRNIALGRCDLQGAA